MSSQSLKGVLFFEHVYTLFGACDDVELLSKLGTFATAYTIMVALASWIRPAPYGKYLVMKRWVLNAKLSCLLQGAPAFLVPLMLLLKSPATQMTNWVNRISIAVFMLHYFQRTLIYPFRVSSQANPVPIYIAVSAFVFCGWNGFYQGHHLINVSSVSSDSVAVWAGAFLIGMGMLVNIYHDGLLIKLRASSKTKAEPVNGGSKPLKSKSKPDPRHPYEIPRGGLFDIISGANYFGEIVEWWGLALITRQFPQVLFAIFSTQLLVQRAWHNHKYYQKVHGSTYPSDRKAIIPYVL